jgi:DNA polymerase III alpha subunit (gram-positive type)
MSASLHNFNEAPLAFTDLETTGSIFTKHEILEIGLVIADQKTLEIIDELNVKVKPIHPEINVPAAMDRNGYTTEGWQDAIPLIDAIRLYSEKSAGAIFFAFNATFDWGFINEAFERTGIPDKMDYHRFDVMSMAYLKLHRGEVDKWRLSSISKYFGIPEEPMPHKAINGARTALEVYKKLLSF